MTSPAPIDAELVESLAGPLAERLGAVHERLQSLGGGEVELLPVSKAHPVEAVVAGLQVGLRTFGENYAQELAAKAAILSSPTFGEGADAGPTWHFVGQLQRNKVRLIADAVSVWQSVDRLRVGTEIAKRAPGATVFAQVNLSEDPNKGGCSFDELPELVQGLDAAGLRVTGLMGVGTAADDGATAAGFRRLRSMVDELGLEHCSMGMTDDLELAIDAGSTMVRLGTAVFGPRT